MKDNKDSIFKTYFDENWSENNFYEKTYSFGESNNNSTTEPDLLSPTANKKNDFIKKIRTPKKNYSEKCGSSQILSKWIGIVTQINDDVFMGKLRNLAINEGFINEAEFTVSELQEDDKELLEIGAVFYWYIGYMTTYGGTRTKISLLKFQRLPQWQKSQINKIKEEAKLMGEKFNWY